jgi:hypothetical protein
MGGPAIAHLRVGQQLPRETVVEDTNMRTILMLVVCGTVMLASGCATCHSSANAWEYKSATTYPEAVGSEVTRFGQESWKFVSMSAVSKAPGEATTVVLLFKRHK